MKWGHLRRVEFIDLLDGRQAPPGRLRHLARCATCRENLAALGEIHDMVREPATVPSDNVAAIDWMRLRSSVRNRLLSRAVRRSSLRHRWMTGSIPRPVAGWGMALALVAVAVAGAGLWSYRTADPATAPGTPASALTPTPAGSGPEVDAGLPPGTIDATGMEEFAWSGTDLFTVLDALEAHEEERLRELISAVETNAGRDGILQ